ncbi:protein white-like [Drosophila miranda]|uniref:protein white-like n=1 Tax=Drosophila miranda TaxID=7229 RepID=UPI00143F91A8|nr:protein white-like [Drosophila miranda]
MKNSIKEEFVSKVCYDLSRCWQSVETPHYSNVVYRLMTYNLLAPDMVVKHKSHYGGIEEQHLNWGHRLNKLTQEVQVLNPDILCLQEMQCSHLPQIMRRFKATTMRSYNYIFQQKLESESDGIAIIYDMKKLELIGHRALGAKSRSPTSLIVCSAHLLQGTPLGTDGRPDIVQRLRSELLQYSHDYENNSCIPIILGGDFNFSSGTKPFRTLTTPAVYSACSKQLVPVYSTATKQVSAYDSKQGWIDADHIFYSKGCPRYNIRVCSYYLLPRICLEQLPNHFLGSDHYSLAVNFTFSVGAQCPTNYNPADFYVQVLAVVPGREAESRERIAKICDNFAVSKVAREMEQLLATKKLEQPLEQPENGYTYKATWFMQFRAVLWRSWLSVLKEPLLVKVRLIQTTMVAILIGLIFLGQQLTQVGVMNINGAIFLFLTNMTFQNVFATINVFTSELPVFMREARSRLYRCDTYFLGKTIAELPLFLTVPLVFTAIAYPMIGLRPGVMHFFNCLALVTLVANVSTSFGYLISCASSSTSMALSVGPPVIIPFLLFGGFFLNSGSVPVYLKWLSYLSWFRYANEGLLINQWADVEAGEISCTSSNTTCPSSGKVILETLNFSAEDLPLDYVGLGILIVSFRVLAYLALRLRARRKE